ncbi:cytochrome P450 [Croceicoccus estronivorus]|uniref:cytochrome P450 n=1 Tax=Croceicoccus estronivorus TaxID=1172626 RepID=UPI000B282C93|nr:cytochrome P450 [Croceicoccus estronivorus]
MIDYDPFSDDAMRDPHKIYAELRKGDGPHFIEKYNAWALVHFEDIWNTSTKHEKDITFTAGQPLTNVLLGEPVPHAFPSMDMSEHRKWRRVVHADYTKGSVEKERERITALAREILAPLAERGSFDFYKEYVNRVLAINAGYNLGLPREKSIAWRGLVDETMHRETGQVGTSSERNLKAAGQLAQQLHAYVREVRANPALAGGHVAKYLAAEIDGQKLDDQGLVNLLIIFLTVGSGTTPNVCAGAVYYLAQNPDQKHAVLNDLSLVPQAFSEAARYDQPTNILCRRAANDFEIRGKQIKAGQNLLMVYASANRDEAEFERAGEFDIFRSYPRDLTFGVGGHMCLGMHLATMAGVILLEEFFKVAGDYRIDTGRCTRAYSEFLSGFDHIPVELGD